MLFSYVVQPLSFKDTSLGPIPEDWKVVPFRDAVIYQRVSLNPGDYPDEEFDYYSIPAYAEFGQPIPEKGGNILSQKLLVEQGDVLFGKLNPRVPKVWLVRSNSGRRRIASTEFIPLESREGISDKEFIYFLLWSQYLLPKSQELVSGSTPSRQRIDVDAFLNVPIPLPPLSEQRAIARVLTTVREAIEATDRVLTAARELKRSLMHHLFTYGPVPVNEADQVALKETEIGEVPEGWTVVKVGDIADIHSGGTPSRSKPEYWNGNIPWVKTGEISYDTITSAEETISQEGFQNSSTKLIPAGTLLMAMYGQGVTRGKVAILGIDATINQACAAFFLNGDVTPKFLFYLFTHHYERIRKMGHGAQQTNLSGTLIKTIPIAFPSPLEEQNQIVSILSDLDRKIQVESQRKAALEALFQSLLHHLMTGKLRTLYPAPEYFIPTREPAYAVRETDPEVHVEALLIAALVNAQYQISQHPVSRFRVTKLSYLYNSFTNRQEALENFGIYNFGPYNPQIRYGGVEETLLVQEYLNQVDETHFQPGTQMDNALQLVSDFHNLARIAQIVGEFGQFRNETLELWTTVDFTARQIHAQGELVSAERIFEFWRKDTVWQAKTEKFTIEEIRSAIQGLHKVFRKFQ